MRGSPAGSRRNRGSVVARAAPMLLLPTPVLGTAYVAAVLARVAAARPDIVALLAPWPLLAVALAVRDGRQRWIVVVAVLELAGLVPLHALVTFVRAWRLEGG